jgi:starvation-inducible DNA-binding protein
MDALQLALRKVLADTFGMYFKAHAYHWNVVGPDFSQYHDFFGKLYEELFGAVDTIAEHIRAIDGMAPNNLSMLTNETSLSDTNPTKAMDMFNDLLMANNLVLVSLMRAYQLADDADELGLANFLQDRIDVHQKHSWMIKATLK